MASGLSPLLCRSLRPNKSMCSFCSFERGAEALTKAPSLLLLLSGKLNFFYLCIYNPAFPPWFLVCMWRDGEG